ncbi:MAG: HDIG domain-containing protein [Bacteroidales bacterium]|nr:HDIG domain-containing protein [Bacteroidales bacterium]
MKKMNEKQKESLKRILLYLAAAVILFFLFPSAGKFKYEYQKGRPWMHETLIAPFDFPIYKTQQEIEQERDSILQLFSPYFQLDTSIAYQQSARLDSSFTKIFSQAVTKMVEEKLVPSYLKQELLMQENDFRTAVLHSLRSIYNQGIVSSVEWNKNQFKQSKTIQIIRNNVSSQVAFNSLYTEVSAYRYLIGNVREQPGLKAYSADQTEQLLHFMNLNEYITGNLFYDARKTELERKSLVSNISLTEGMVLEGERIISKGEIVSDEKFKILESLRIEYNQRVGITGHKILLLLGQFILSILSVLMIFLFLQSFRKEVFGNQLKTLFILFIILFMSALTRLVISYSQLSVYVIPFALIAIIVKTFYDSRIALFILITTLFITAFWVPNAFEFVFMNFVAGIVAIFSLSNQYRRGKLFITSVLVLLAYTVVFAGISLLEEGRWNSVSWGELFWFTGNSLLLLSAYPLMFIFEKTFGFLSDASLTELSDTNQPLLRQLAELAPGTFQHSLQVANLAEDAVRHIGGNALLVRTGALYHDIGKMENPLYFIENQTPGTNIHEHFDAAESARIVISHVENGLLLARKNGLPEQISDFISTHHGTTLARYFYYTWLKNNKEESNSEHLFRYPGPRPFSKETAVVMMADAVEAASRSLTKVDESSLTALVNEIIDQQMHEEQFNDADITFKDITTIKNVFIQRLRNIYHARIAYPKRPLK